MLFLSLGPALQVYTLLVVSDNSVWHNGLVLRGAGGLKGVPLQPCADGAGGVRATEHHQDGEAANKGHFFTLLGPCFAWARPSELVLLQFHLSMATCPSKGCWSSGGGFGGDGGSREVVMKVARADAGQHLTGSWFYSPIKGS